MPEFQDPYLDPSTGILRNLLGVSSQPALDVREAQLTAVAAIGIGVQPVKPTGDLRELCAIHQRLFEKVYDWAGKLRTVDMRKGNDRDAEFFMSASRLDSGAGFAFSELAEDNHLKGLGKEQFVDRLAHHYDQVNYLHPFREGNGRAQRILWTNVARRAGWALHWTDVTGAQNDQASRDAMERQDLAGLREIFTRITVPLGPQPVSSRRVSPEATSSDRKRRFPELFPAAGSTLSSTEGESDLER
jgi:cell filamentation protein